jgi:hypothetical protein
VLNLIAKRLMLAKICYQVFREQIMHKIGFLLVAALVFIELSAMNFALANKTTASFSAFVRINNHMHTDILGNIIFSL